MVDRRIAKEVRKTKEAKTALEETKTQLSELQERLSKLENADTSKKPGESAKSGPQVDGIHPLFLVENEAELNTREQWLLDALDFADENREGYEPKNPEDPEDVAIDAETIRRNARIFRRELSQVLPKAREMVKQRAQHEAAARKRYPRLFEAGEDSVMMKAILARAPGLKALPEYKLLVGAYLAAVKAVKPQEKETKAPGKAPAMPDAGGGTKLARMEAPKKTEKDFDVKKFAEEGGSRAALVTQLAGMMG